MPAIWTQKDNQWRPLEAEPYANEQDLHDLIARAPHLLPLSGRPELLVVGTEVQLGAGRADVLAVQADGRVVVIEVKLGRNAEARRAVVAQILSYAAWLHGYDVDSFEREILAPYLHAQTGQTSLVSAMEARLQRSDFDAAEFRAELGKSLEQGRFRLVIVLDEAPSELVEIAGYLEAMSDRWVIDLVTVASYKVEGQRVLVPQRIAPQRIETETPQERMKAKEQGRLVAGPDDFLVSIAEARLEHQEGLRRLVAWAQDLERAGLARLFTYHGVGRKILLPRFQPDNVGLATVWNERGPAIQLWRSVFERKAPRALERVAALIAPVEVRQGNSIREASPELLAALTDAYREANGW